MSLILYSYYRSSASFRVRIALELKKIDYEIKPIHLLKNGGEQHSVEFQAVNPQELVPALVIDDHQVITQSLAIIDYLDEVYPEPKLYPESAFDKAYIKSLALMIACDLHPLNNSGVLQYLKDKANFSEEDKKVWMHHWFKKNLTAFEQRLIQSGKSGKYCFQDQVTVADLFLIPQLLNATRFEFDLKPYEKLCQIFDNCMELEAFQKAHPSQQMDAE